jgi:hypothetical protein
MTVTVHRRQNFKPHKAVFWYRNISKNSHTKKHGNTLKGMGDRCNDCDNSKGCPRNRLPPDGGILHLSSRHPVQINDRNDDHVPCICGSLSPRHGASSGCGWRSDLLYGGYLWINWISSRGQPTRSGPPAWGLGEVLTTPLRKKTNVKNYPWETLSLETKQSGGKLLPHSDLRGGGGSVSKGSITQP